ncbi:MAG: elongation factor Ts [Proteobacteria bacterium]|jgi:elongation factor Ts|nr:elongation factor Ts [Pseudomonadota bacterium]MBT5819656.1 elongation factor Ts [Pseudomonadota bacterium]MBT6349784.1 elongation factor Ts [Pseudomonadota bacterium]
MPVTASEVKALRELTGAGMMECKKALTETHGDLDEAIALLRKKGAASAEKKSGRIAAEGVITFAINDEGTTAILVEVNCETDFVAKDNSFKDFSTDLANTLLEGRPESVEDASQLQLAGGATIEATRQELIAKIGENISLRRFEVVQAGPGELAGYVHGSRIGVIIRMDSSTEPDLGRDIAMHVAASRPVCIDESEMPDELLQKERDIYTAQAAESGKPPEIAEKMVTGRIKKFLKENTLLGQPFVKNPDESVGDLLSGQQASVVSMSRFEVGEGLEKRSDDFVAEVMAQAQGG